MTPEEYLCSGQGDAADRSTGVPTVRACMVALQLDPDQEITPTIAKALMDVRDGHPPEAVAARYDLPWIDGEGEV